MPRTGATYNLPTNLNYPAQDGEVIEPLDHNEVLEDLGQAVTDSVSRDGAGNMSGDLNMGTNKLTNLAAGSAPGHSVRYEQVQLASAVATAFEGLGWAAGKMAYATGSTAFSLIDTTSFGRGLLNAANAAALGIAKADVGLGNVDNTSDANKPVSSATQTALNGKMPAAGPSFANISMNDAYSVAWGNAGIQGYNGSGGYIIINVNGSNKAQFNPGSINFAHTPTIGGTDTVMTRGATETVTGAKTFSYNGATTFNRPDSGLLKVEFKDNGTTRGWLASDSGSPFAAYNAALSANLTWNGGSQVLVAGKAAAVHAGSYTSFQVTISTSSPSGGSDGDVWFQYS